MSGASIASGGRPSSARVANVRLYFGGVLSHSAAEVIANYAWRTKDELARTLPLERGEELVVAFEAVTRYTGSSVFVKGRRGYLRLSTERLCVLRHDGFIRDRIIVIPPGAIKERTRPRARYHR